MTNIYGSPGDEPGDQQVYAALECLPKDWVVYAQPKIVKGDQEGNPDYVLLHRDYGYIVLEVKDWVSIKDPDAKGVLVERRHRPEPEWELSPVEQGRKHAQLIMNKLTENPDLRDYRGKLDFPYRYAGILPNLPSSTIAWLEGYWGKNQVLGRLDLTQETITQKITQIPAKFTVSMTDRQFDAVRVVLDKSNAVRDINTGQFKGVYSQNQEEIAKYPHRPPTEKALEIKPGTQENLWGEFRLDPQARLSKLESDVPEEVLELRKARNVKLVRGFSGTGKTDVLVMRARYLYNEFPGLQMLVTTFNLPLVEERLALEFRENADRIRVNTFDSLCKTIYQKRTGSWPNIQDISGVIKNLEVSDEPVSAIIQKYGATFIEQEIGWIKDTDLVDKGKYLSTHREGQAKASGKTLQPSQKEEIYQVFQAYQNRLQNDLRAFDWQDMHKKVWEFIETGTLPDVLFDIILLDEAQHFAPIWLKIVIAHLKANGSLFICDDPSQSVYRLFSWQQRGIDVRGKTRWLRIPYRTTREIFETAFLLISTNPLSKKLVDESGEINLPDLSDPAIRRGERPVAYSFSSFDREKEFVQKEIARLINKILPSEIAILHSEKYILDAYKTLVPPGVRVDDLKRRTGMEYKVVFIPQVHKLFTSCMSFDYEQVKAEHQLALYMAMTRARDQVYFLYANKWPNEYEPMRPNLNWFEG